MRYALSAHGTRTRIVGAIAAIVVLCFAMTRPADIAQGRVDPTGQGQLIGDCTAPASECPSNTPAFQSVLVYVQDNSDTGANDVFQISFCTGPAVVSPLGCGAAEGGALRTGQIQIRASVPGSGGMSVPTAARAPLRLP